MANNYTSFAENLKMPREAARYAVALDALCSDLADFGQSGADEEEGDTWEPPKIIEGVPVDERMILDAHAIVEPSADFYGSSTTFEAGETSALYVASDESGDIEVVVAIVQATMARFDLPGAVHIQWANTCSKLRPGEFGGGAVVITKDDEEWMTTSRWVDEKIAELVPATVAA